MGKRAAAHVESFEHGDDFVPHQLSESRLAECKAQVCGACLLELGADSTLVDSDGRARVRPRRSCTLPRLGLIDGCSHVFHDKCLEIWAKVENSCPQCRMPFRWLTSYDLETGQQWSCKEVESRDQVDWEALGAPSDDDTGEACVKCGSRKDAGLLLLCDGRQGCCSRSCHTYCDGLGRTLPQGNWFCHMCRLSPAEWGREATAVSRQRHVAQKAADSQDAACRPAAKRRAVPTERSNGTSSSASSSSGRSGSMAINVASPAMIPSSTPDISQAIPTMASSSTSDSGRPHTSAAGISTFSGRRGRGRGYGSSRASAILAAQLKDMAQSKPAAALLPSLQVRAESQGDAMHEESPKTPRMEPTLQSELLSVPSSSKMVQAAKLDSMPQRKTFGRLRSRATVMHTIDVDADDARPGSKMDLDMPESPSVCTENVTLQLQAADGHSTDPPAAEQPKKWFLLALPPQYEAWTERFRRFASTYLVLERGLPHVVRKADRLWSLSVAGLREPSGSVLEAQCDGWEVSLRRMMHFAHDTFKLHWASAMDPAEEDPCSLRCLRTAKEHVLSVLYCGSPGRMKPSDVVRGELQFRRRLVEHLHKGHLPEELLPPCPMPSVDTSDASGTSLPAARASAAVRTSTAAASLAAAAIGEAEPLDVGPQLLAALRKEPWYRGQIAFAEHKEPRAADFATLGPVLDTRLVRALNILVNGERDSENSQLQLYVHQAEAIDAAVSAGRDVVISTSTGSGKSLVYLAAVFDTLLRDDEATAIFVFPTKALAQDQLGKLNHLVNALGKCGVSQEQIVCACLDGDTPQKDRGRVRRAARVVLTNPDMLHSHLLPRHGEYGRLLGQLRYVVLDEMHVYRGAFGAHVASVVRRLRRLLGEEEKESLRFVACSATVSNPGEHFQRLVGPRSHTPKVITTDGSPSGGAGYVLWNPGPRTSSASSVRGGTGGAEAGTGGADGDDAEDEELPIERESSAREDTSRRSPIVEVARLLAWLVARNVSVLAFCKWRSLVEIILQDVQEALVACGKKDISKRVVSYRAGYAPTMRRELERQIFSREALGVVCTNALELGVDIGRLDCTISLGFPGSISSLRQQFGRAGRAGRAGMSFFVAFDDPTDQHIMRNPAEFLSRCPEAVALAPLNPAVLRGHLQCAAVEQALTASDAKLWEPCASDETSLFGSPVAVWTHVLEQCKTDGLVEEHSEGHQQVFTGVGAPHRSVSIRAIDARYEVVVEGAGSRLVYDDDAVGGFTRPGAEAISSVASGKVIDELEASKAFYSIHPGAVYRCRGEEYQIVDLNLHRRRATARKCEAPLAYYTRAFDSTVYRILTEERHVLNGRVHVFGGQVERESRVKSFKKYWKSRDSPFENEVTLELPSWNLHTRGLWFEYSGDAPMFAAHSDSRAATREPACDCDRTNEGWNWAGAHAAMHALLHVLPRFVLADRADLDAACVDEYGAPPMERPRLLLYDSREGGTGLCDAAFSCAFAMLREARRLVEECPCEDGCPSCILYANCREYNRLLSKQGALAWLQGLEGNIDELAS